MPLKVDNRVGPTVKVVSFDPGITTGYATGFVQGGELGVVSGQDIWNELGLWLELKRNKPDIVIYETFEYRNTRHKKGPDNTELFSRNLIGVINLYVQERASEGELVQLHDQSPAYGKGFFNDQTLKKEGVYKEGHPHANDAMRHMLHWWQFGSGFQFNTKGFTSLA